MTIEKQILAQCLNNTFYKKASDVVGKEMFANGVGTVFDTISFAHDKYGEDLTTEMLLQLHRDRFPSMPDSSRESIELVIKDLTNYVQDNPEMMQDLIVNFWRRDRAQKIGSKATDIWLGNEGDYEGLRVLVDELINKQPEDSTNYSRVEDDVADFLETHEKGFEFHFELESLQDRVGGVGRGNLGIIFARPETGKTTFLASEMTHMITQTEGDILWFNNEEQGKKVAVRCYQALLGKTNKELFDDLESNANQYKERIQDRLKIYDFEDSSRANRIEQIIKTTNPALIIFDQVDKIKGFKADRYDLELKATYQWAREIAKMYAPVIAVSQAGGTAEGKLWLTMDDVDSSKTAKQGEADWILGIGKEQDNTSNMRFLNISKNKLLGDSDTLPDLRHGNAQVMIKPDIARYNEI